LLFTATEKYPEENAFNNYLTTYSGHSNAFTASTSTNYYFELSYPSSTPPSSKAATSNESHTQSDASKERMNRRFGEH
jgi:insulysin